MTVGVDRAVVVGLIVWSSGHRVIGAPGERLVVGAFSSVPLGLGVVWPVVIATPQRVWAASSYWGTRNRQPPIPLTASGASCACARKTKVTDKKTMYAEHVRVLLESVAFLNRLDLLEFLNGLSSKRSASRSSDSGRVWRATISGTPVCGARQIRPLRSAHQNRIRVIQGITCITCITYIAYIAYIASITRIQPIKQLKRFQEVKQTC